MCGNIISFLARFRFFYITKRGSIFFAFQKNIEYLILINIRFSFESIAKKYLTGNYKWLQIAKKVLVRKKFSYEKIAPCCLQKYLKKKRTVEEISIQISYHKNNNIV